MIRRVAREALKEPIQPLVTQEPRLVSTDQAAPSPADRMARALVALLGAELRLAPEHVRAVVERELTRVQAARRVVLRVHPEDLALLDSTETLRARHELRAPLSFEADETLSRGGCVIDSDLGQLDARLETRLSLALALVQSGAL
jgi:flagellar biosynthesis/type III secretory pathway protein FliH